LQKWFLVSLWMRIVYKYDDDDNDSALSEDGSWRWLFVGYLHEFI